MKIIIKNFKTNNLTKPKFVHPFKLTYEQNGIKKQWESVKSFDSVSILLYHEEFDSFLLVKQFRAPVYLNDKTKLYTYELCAGIVDKNTSLEQIAKEEILEECGYEVTLESIEKISSCYTNVGVSGALQTMFYAKIDESMKKHEGGGINDEEIETAFVKVEDYKNFIYDESKAKTPGLMFSFFWFMDRRNSL